MYYRDWTIEKRTFLGARILRKGHRNMEWERQERILWTRFLKSNVRCIRAHVKFMCACILVCICISMHISYYCRLNRPSPVALSTHPVVARSMYPPFPRVPWRHCWFQILEHLLFKTMCLKKQKQKMQWMPLRHRSHIEEASTVQI